MVDPAEAFYVRDGDGRYLPTTATESPWDPDAQHGGPPSALLSHVIEALDPEPAFRTARITVELLGAVPRTPLTAAASWLRPGRRIRLAEASLSSDGRPVALARAWQIAVDPALGVPTRGAPTETPALPGEQPQQYLGGRTGWGYGQAIEWRWVRGGYAKHGPGAVWTRVRIPLVGGHALTPLDRVLVVADSANGISAELPLEDWLFVPPAVTVTLHRPPAGDWVLLGAETTLAGDGVGSTLGHLADAQGPLGTVTQPLLVARR